MYLTPISNLNIPENVIQDLTKFISVSYKKNLPNSLLIAQAFILKYPNYGKDIGLPPIYNAIEEGIKQGIFNNSENL